MNNRIIYVKELTKNDLGRTASHQAGVHIPKNSEGPLAILPKLDKTSLNPECYIECIDPTGLRWRFRFVYYNSKLHKYFDSISGKVRGTRNEYRLCQTNKFLHEYAAELGDELELALNNDGKILISLRKKLSIVCKVVKLRGWRKIY